MPLRTRRPLLTTLVVVVLASLLGSVATVAAAADRDRDGLPDWFERDRSRTSLTRADTDRDGVRDGWEDLDRDRLTNRQEYLATLHPRLADSDRDGRRDDAEDQDGDGLSTWMEFRAGTHPRRVDTDRDGLRDDLENPDRDGLTNRQEQLSATHPRSADTDHDGRRDELEDTDADGLWHRTEFLAAIHPLRRDTDADGTPDGAEDPDGDSLDNLTEQWFGFNPLDPDTDDDGLSDADELAAAGVDGPTLPGIPGCPVFPATNVWNRQVDELPVAANSSTLIGSIGLTARLHMDFGSYAGYGIPYNVVDASTTGRTVTFDYDDESDQVGYPIPGSPLIEGGSGADGDRHILIVDRDACRLYELFAARLEGGSWHAGSGATWDLRSNDLRPAGWTSADAAGLPILPGLIRYDEVAAGEIAHALRFTARQTRRSYVYPARHQAGASASAALPPMGLRVRLKASANLAGLSPHARTIARAFQAYGLILADNGSPWYVTGVSDPRFNDDVLHELDRFTGASFEVVDTTGLVNGP